MIKTLLAQVKEFKKASFLTPVFMILEDVVAASSAVRCGYAHADCRECRTWVR